MDTCYSGGFSGDELRRGTVDFTSAYQDLVSGEHGLVIWASSTGKEQSVERDEWRNGAFTGALLEGISTIKADLNRDYLLSDQEVAAFMGNTVKSLTDGKQHFVPFRLKILNLDLTINNAVLIQPRPSTMAPTTPIHAIEGDASFGGYT